MGCTVGCTTLAQGCHQEGLLQQWLCQRGVAAGCHCDSHYLRPRRAVGCRRHQKPNDLAKTVRNLRHGHCQRLLVYLFFTKSCHSCKVQQSQHLLRSKFRHHAVQEFLPPLAEWGTGKLNCGCNFHIYLPTIRHTV